MLAQINSYFGVTMQRIATDDWDEAEAILTRVLKSKAAAPDFKPEMAAASTGSMDS